MYEKLILVIQLATFVVLVATYLKIRKRDKREK